MLIKCELSMVSIHHATHSALLALGVLLPSCPLFFICVYLFCFLGGLEAMNVGQVHGQLSDTGDVKYSR